MIIYKVTNKINGKIYIGQTILSLKRRKNIHYSSAKKSLYKSVFHFALLKYKKQDFIWKILRKCNTKKELDRLEKYYIRKLKTKIPNGYNLTDGGEGCQGMKQSIYAKQLASNRMKRKNPNYVHGKCSFPHYCIDCKKPISGYRAKRCKSCAQKGELNSSKKERNKLNV